MIKKSPIFRVRDREVIEVVELSQLGEIWTKANKLLFDTRSSLMDLGFSQEQAERMIDSYVWRGVFND